MVVLLATPVKGSLMSFSKRTLHIAITNCLFLKVKEAPFKVYHYHFTDWPDCGVPSSPSPLLNLLRHIHTTHSLPSSPPPLLVHCSAGVGRTGTLLAVDRLLHQLQAGAHSVNVLQTVRELRRCRPRMVQNAVSVNIILTQGAEADIASSKCRVHSVQARV